MLINLNLIQTRNILQKFDQHFNPGNLDCCWRKMLEAVKKKIVDVNKLQDGQYTKRENEETRQNGVKGGKRGQNEANGVKGGKRCMFSYPHTMNTIWLFNLYYMRRIHTLLLSTFYLVGPCCRQGTSARTF